MLITIPPMPTIVGSPCPEVTFDLTKAGARAVAQRCAEIHAHKLDVSDGLCGVISIALNGAGKEENAVYFGIGMAVRPFSYLSTYLQHHEEFDGYEYLDEYLDDRVYSPLREEVMTSIRHEWAAHIARSIYEQIGE